MSADLIAWLRAQLDDDERAARNAGSYGRDRWTYDHETFRVLAPDVDPANEQCPSVIAARRSKGVDSEPLLDVDGEHIARHDPARVLRDVAAKRAILDLYAEHAEYDNVDESFEHATGRIVGLGEAVRHLAAAYADRPGYRPEWAPTPDGAR